MAKHGQTLKKSRVPKGWADAGAGIGILRVLGIPLMENHRKTYRNNYGDDWQVYGETIFR